MTAAKFGILFLATSLIQQFADRAVMKVQFVHKQPLSNGKLFNPSRFYAFIENKGLEKASTDASTIYNKPERYAINGKRYPNCGQCFCSLLSQS